MPTLARADLESLLRIRKLDRTLTSALPRFATADEQVIAATGIPELDARLGGGFPRGHLSEITGAASSGRTTIAVAALAAAARRGELVALVDALDTFDLTTAADLDLDRLLWVRGFVATNPGLCRDANPRAAEQALKALTLVLQAGNFGVVALDVAGAPADVLRRLPFTTWLRLQRMIEGTQTTCLIVADAPVARSSAGMTVVVSRQPAVGSRESSVVSLSRQPRLFEGLDIEARVVQARYDRSRTLNPESRITPYVRLHLQAAV